MSRYCDWSNTPSTLKDGAAVPETSLIKNYITWWAESSCGRIEDVVSVTSAGVTWARFQAVIFRITGNQVPRKTNEDILSVGTYFLLWNGLLIAAVDTRRSSEGTQLVRPEETKRSLWRCGIRTSQDSIMLSRRRWIWLGKRPYPDAVSEAIAYVQWW